MPYDLRSAPQLRQKLEPGLNSFPQFGQNGILFTSISILPLIITVSEFNRKKAHEESLLKREYNKKGSKSQKNWVFHSIKEYVLCAGEDTKEQNFAHICKRIS